MKNLLFWGLSLCLAGLGQAQTTAKSTSNYGVTSTAPILVGGVDLRKGPSYEREYLERLTGPNGEKVTYTRTGSCCEFETPNGFLGGGLLDTYEITYQGLEAPVVLYINMYDPDPDGVIEAPKGFRIKD